MKQNKINCETKKKLMINGKKIMKGKFFLEIETCVYLWFFNY